MTTVTIEIPWKELHLLIEEVDRLRSNRRYPFGYNGLYDAFGGTYSAERYEQQGLPGLIAVSCGLDMIAEDVWKVFHEKCINAKNEPTKEKRQQVVDEIRGVAETARAVAEAKDLLFKIGVRRDPKGEICGTGPGYGLTGLMWLAGYQYDTFPLPDGAMDAFIEGASPQEAFEGRTIPERSYYYDA